MQQERCSIETAYEKEDSMRALQKTAFLRMCARFCGVTDKSAGTEAPPGK